MKIDEKDAAVLAAFRLNSELPIPDAAKVLGFKQSTVRASLLRLKRRGLMRRFALINLSALGYVEYDVSARITNTGTNNRDALFAFLSQSPVVSFILESAGSYQCIFTVVARGPVGVESFLEDIADKFGGVLGNVSIGTCVRYSIFPPKYLASRLPSQKKVEVTTFSTPIAISKEELQVLHLISENPELSARELSKQLQVPSSTVHYRLTALRKKGLISGDMYMIYPEKYGYSHERIYLSLRSISKESKKAIAAYAEKHPNITYLLEWLGYWQFCFGINVLGSEQSSQVANQITDICGSNVSDICIFPVMKEHKVSFCPFH